MTEFLSSLDKASLEKLCGKKVLVTGSSGHLGEALCRTLHAQSSALSLQCQVVSLDILPSEFTTHVGSILDREVVKEVLQGVDVVFHTATLHKPHIVSHTNQDFVDINVTGTLNLLEESLISGVKAFIFTSSTTVFGDAMKSANPVWVTENLNPIPKNIYGVTKLAAENLCELFHRNHGLSCLVLRTSRFFLELDDDPKMLDMFTDKNIKCQEYLYRRVDIQDAVDAHLLAALKCKEIGFDKYIISASTKFSIGDAESLQNNADEVLLQHCPDYLAIYQKLGWKMFTRFDRGMLSGRANRKILQ
jgi:UDP-glucose 4-epimerase